MKNAGKRLQKILALLSSPADKQSISCSLCAEETRLLESEHDHQTIDEIRSDWAAQGLGDPPSDREIVSVALHLMQTELEAGLGDEVMEDLRREVEYRHWCAATEDARAVPIPGEKSKA